jgi:hypothetical protein
MDMDLDLDLDKAAHLVTMPHRSGLISLGPCTFATSQLFRLLTDTSLQQNLQWPQHDLCDCCARDCWWTGKLAGM